MAISSQIFEEQFGGKRPDAVLIAGPTASGKSALALQAAQHWGGEIVNVDSMQIYPVLHVLTARPPQEDLACVPHHLYGYADPAQTWSTERWRLDAQGVMAEIKAKGAIPVLVGGTGLYFRALDEGLSRVPPIPETIREDVRHRLVRDGSEALHGELASLDRAGAQGLAPGDSHRIARALEVVLATGKPLAHFQNQVDSPPLTQGMKCHRIILEPPRPVLHERINTRSEWMLNNGAVEEVEELLKLHLPHTATIMRAIGVPQISDYLAQTIDRKLLLERLQAATRQYAKRQSTWFRGQFDARWQRLTFHQG
ncbi:MAG: tRNA (adenosine(37)-N6)-dimethylallyltransferase MiaA [Pseudomonadota bacterium]